jgi:vacuolar-type H+-ATPase subunit H
MSVNSPSDCRDARRLPEVRGEFGLVQRWSISTVQGCREARATARARRVRRSPLGEILFVRGSIRVHPIGTSLWQGRSDMSDQSPNPNVDAADPVARLRAEIEQTLERIRTLPDDAAAITSSEELLRLIAWTHRCAEELLAAARADADDLVRRAEQESSAILRDTKNAAAGLHADGLEYLRSRLAALEAELTADSISWRDRRAMPQGPEVQRPH